METWYVLEDGSCGDPREIVAGKDGKLRHKDGRAVAYADHGPRSRSVDPAAERRKAKAEKPAAETTAEPKEMAAEAPAKPYKNREMRTGKRGRAKTR